MGLDHLDLDHYIPNYRMDSKILHLPTYFQHQNQGPGKIGVTLARSQSVWVKNRKVKYIAWIGMGVPPSIQKTL